ncbi:DUF3899 domain-containing protein [Bacillus sp. CECT 9360]|uniref:DUF3899 domain-containing protein n=1 Tax=Bacillus sp. CECT 9360 TaxID=2845821 RepID=UPI001EF9C310|nr:hypothetical protein BCI9360_03069 [Bacillus sp. CECT 9360]
MFRINIYVILGTLFFSTLVSYYFNHSFNRLIWINTLFSFSLMLTLLGGMMLVIQGGFFSGIIRSFRLFFWKTSPMKQVLEEIEGKREDSSPYLLSFRFTFPFLYSGTSLLLFSIIFSWYIS